VFRNHLKKPVQNRPCHLQRAQHLAPDTWHLV
jgi:hypothetical protein